ncbi:uncharacterized protein LOC131649188 [Vicia villosa]|uniref:uncharacterized protein LOC131649188 n=1 Tax=Vicia villosa TaxID=3911 RepID=UPI00273AF5BF|nr:uncharacterized protein LOC131649188 [Vicia villosa]
MRGCGSQAKKRALRKLICDARADVCVVQESKLHSLDFTFVNSLWSDSGTGWSAKWAEGRSGGIIIFWKMGVLEVVASFMGEGFLGIHAVWKGFSVFFVNVYASYIVDKKRVFWASLRGFQQRFPKGLWCMGEILIWCFDGMKEGIEGVMVGDRSVSDHCPIWLFGSYFDWGPKPFKFFKCWCDHKEFYQFVEASKLKVWNKEVFGVLDLDVDKAVSSLNALDLEVANVMSGGGMGGDNREARVVASKEVWESMLVREGVLRQKSRCNWIRLGDSNSRFFHSFMKGRFRRNNILSLDSDGGRLMKVEDIRREVFNHFKNCFTEPMLNRPVLDGAIFSVFSSEDRVMLEAPFLLEEFKSVVWLDDCEKSPGPDGFPLGFFKTCWEFVKDDVVNFVQDFYAHGVLSRDATASFLALIPKTVSPLSVDEFRPICFVGCLYRLISKILAGRLRLVIREADFEVSNDLY